MGVENLWILVVLRVLMNNVGQEHYKISFCDLKTTIFQPFWLLKSYLDSRNIAIVVGLAHEHEKGEIALRFFNASVDEFDLFQPFVARVCVFYLIVDVFLDAGSPGQGEEQERHDCCGRILAGELEEERLGDNFVLERYFF